MDLVRMVRRHLAIAMFYQVRALQGDFYGAALQLGISWTDMGAVWAHA